MFVRRLFLFIFLTYFFTANVSLKSHPILQTNLATISQCISSINKLLKGLSGLMLALEAFKKSSILQYFWEGLKTFSSSLKAKYDSFVGYKYSSDSGLLDGDFKDYIEELKALEEHTIELLNKLNEASESSLKNRRIRDVVSKFLEDIREAINVFYLEEERDAIEAESDLDDFDDFSDFDEDVYF